MQGVGERRIIQESDESRQMIECRYTDIFSPYLLPPPPSSSSHPYSLSSSPNKQRSSELMQGGGNRTGVLGPLEIFPHEA